MASKDSATRSKTAGKECQKVEAQLSFLPFDELLQSDREKLVRSFSGKESLAREFWDEIGNEIEFAEMVGCGWDLKMIRAGSTASAVRSQMEVVYNSCRRLLQALDAETCNHLIHPPNLLKLNSREREVRRLKIEAFRSLLHEVAADADPDNGWERAEPLRFRLDYVLASKVQLEVECADPEHGLKTRSLLTLVFDCLGINTDAKDALKGASLIFR